MIRNDAVLPRLQISENEFKKHIKNQFLKSRPTACVRWHARGWCFAGCPKSHDKPSKAEKDEIYAFLVKAGIKK